MRGFAILLLVLNFSCVATQPQQGIKGQVFWISGNQLPGPDAVKSAHYGVQREVHIYELTTLQDATMSSDGFFTDIKTRHITTITTKADGSFMIKLPSGDYSVFVKEAAGLYANLFNKNNAINPVAVKDGQYTWLPISIDYEAAY